MWMQLAFQNLFHLNSSHFTLSRRILQSFVTSDHFDTVISVKMAAVCKQFSIPLQLLRTNIDHVLIANLIVRASCSSGVLCRINVHGVF